MVVLHERAVLIFLFVAVIISISNPTFSSIHFLSFARSPVFLMMKFIQSVQALNGDALYLLISILILIDVRFPIISL